MSITDHPPRELDPPIADRTRVRLPGGRAHGEYRARWGWAISPGVVADDHDRELALSGFLDVLRGRRLRPLFTDLRDPQPLARRGFDIHHYADTAVLDLPATGPATTLEPELDNEVSVARTWSTVLTYQAQQDAAAEALASCAPDDATVQTFVAVDAHSSVQGLAVWSTPTGGHDDTRTLHLVSAPPTASRATVALLIADAAQRFRIEGVHRLELGRRRRGPWWPRPLSPTPHEGHTELVAGFGFRWEPRWLALPSRAQLPLAAAVLRRAGA